MLASIGSMVTQPINSLMRSMQSCLPDQEKIIAKTTMLALAVLVVSNEFFNSLLVADQSSDTAFENCMSSNCTQTDILKYGNCFRNCMAETLGNNS